MSVPSVFLVALMAFPQAGAIEASPIEKIVEMVSDLQAKVISEGNDAQKVYDEYSEWCSDRSTNLGFEIKTGKADVAEYKATIEEEVATIGALEAKIEEVSGDIQKDEADVAAATKIREREAADFAAEQSELNQVISMLERATSILSKEMAKSGASMLQLKSAGSITEALGAMVQASVLSTADASRLTALVQTSQDSSDSDSESGAPSAAVYEGQSGGIVGTLEGLTEKAQAQLDSARKAERTSLQNFEMLKQSLTDEIKFANDDMTAAKKDLAEAQEGTANAQGGLEAASKDLADDVATKATLHHDCMNAAEEFELATKSRGEELSALAAAKKVIVESTGGAAGQSYGFNQVSLLQLSDGATPAVRFVRDLARKSKSTALAQLAARMASAVKLSDVSGQDPFAQVKGLITEMLATLESEAEADATQKAYCDKELSETTAKKEDLTTASHKLSTKIAQAKAGSAKLKEQVATLQNELASMAKSRAAADQLRVQEKAIFDKNSAEMKQGVEGVQTALSVLKEYYAKGDEAAAEGAGSGIIGLLEVCESDFSKGLVEMTAQEESAVADYQAYVKQDQIDVASKGQDVKYKSKDAAGLDKTVSELSGDLSSVTDELAAVTIGLDKLKEMCVAKASPYEERAARRQSEIAGLKEAMTILEGEAALVQTSAKHTLRGSNQLHLAA